MRIAMSREEFAQQILLKLVEGKSWAEIEVDNFVEMCYRIADAHAAYGSRDLRSAPADFKDKMDKSLWVSKFRDGSAHRRSARHSC